MNTGDRNNSINKFLNDSLFLSSFLKSSLLLHEWNISLCEKAEDGEVVTIAFRSFLIYSCKVSSQTGRYPRFSSFFSVSPNLCITKRDFRISIFTLCLNFSLVSIQESCNYLCKIYFHKTKVLFAGRTFAFKFYLTCNWAILYALRNGTAPMQTQ